jgi:nicotinate phosphoribosyltransferase
MNDQPDTDSHPLTSLALATDLYQLTMAQGYYCAGLTERQAVFHMFYRSPPFGGRYVVAAGQNSFGDWLENHRFNSEDIAFLSSLTGRDGRPLFQPDFLEYITTWKFRGSIEAVPEGTIMFPHEPIMRVRAPLLDAQLVETTLLTLINFQTLIATKASRVRLAAGGDEVLEFGLRRAHGLDGGLSASRAAYIGGVDATSNVLAAARFGIPVRGTHAHSWVMAFDSEPQAFAAYIDLFPHNSVLLVDTYDTLEGVRNAIEAGRKLRERGEDLMGVRLDSGDLAYLSIRARQLLDENGFHDTKIVASNDLDERLITSLKSQGAPINVWGVGTKLATSFDEPALGGVYKLAAIENRNGETVERIKLSEQSGKTSLPGSLDVARLTQEGINVGDVIFDTLIEDPPSTEDRVITIISPEDPWKRKLIPAKGLRIQLLLKPLFAGGERVGKREALAAMRERTFENLRAFDRAIFRFDNPHAYPAGLSQELFRHRETMRSHEFEIIKQRIGAAHQNSGTPGGKPHEAGEEP